MVKKPLLSLPFYYESLLLLIINIFNRTTTLEVLG